MMLRLAAMRQKYGSQPNGMRYGVCGKRVKQAA